MSELRKEFELWWESLDEETKIDNHKFSALMGWIAANKSKKFNFPAVFKMKGHDYVDLEHLKEALELAGVIASDEPA